MTTKQAIQQELHYAKLQLNRASKAKTSNEIDALHLTATIEHYKKEVEQLETQLNKIG